MFTLFLSTGVTPRNPTYAGAMTHLEFDVVTALDPAAAWRAWSTELGMAEWFWPQWPDTDYRFDPSRDKQWRIASESVGVGVSGDVTKVKEPQELDFTWRWEDGDSVGDPEKVTVRLAPEGKGTRCKVTHECAEADADGLRQGWDDCLERFAALS